MTPFCFKKATLSSTQGLIIKWNTLSLQVRNSMFVLYGWSSWQVLLKARLCIYSRKRSWKSCKYQMLKISAVLTMSQLISLFSVFVSGKVFLETATMINFLLIRQFYLHLSFPSIFSHFLSVKVPYPGYIISYTFFYF